MTASADDVNEVRQTVSEIKDRQSEMFRVQQNGIELHTRTYNELRHIAETLGHVHKQVLATNGRVTAHDGKLTTIDANVAALQESEQWRAGAIAVPKAVIALLKQQRVIQAIIALAALAAGVLNLPPWAGDAIKIVVGAIVPTGTPTP